MLFRSTPTAGDFCDATGAFANAVASSRTGALQFGDRVSARRFASSGMTGAASLHRGNRSRCRALKSTRSEEHTSELQSLMRISYAVIYLKKKMQNDNTNCMNLTK